MLGICKKSYKVINYVHPKQLEAHLGEWEGKTERIELKDRPGMVELRRYRLHSMHYTCTANGFTVVWTVITQEAHRSELPQPSPFEHDDFGHDLP